MAVTGVLAPAGTGAGVFLTNASGPGAAGPASNEDAAAIVQEFFSSLDNLPHEVQFLLEEMRIKEERINNLLKRIETRSATVFKNARPKPGAPAQELSSKDQQSLDKIPLEWSKITEHQAEKSALAERLLTLVNRARERGRDEWRKVATADEYETGVDPHESDLVDKVVAGSEVAVLGVLQGLKAQAGSVGLVGALQKGGLLPPTPGASTPTDEKMVKKRKTGMFTNMPPPATPLATSNIANSNYAPSVAASNHRKRRAQSPSESVPPSAMDGDEMDGEGEEDDGNGDDALYCICQQKSYGEMIGCDNDDCRYEWFHLKCVKLEPPLPATWYCPSCIAEMEQKAQRKRDGHRKRK